MLRYMNVDGMMQAKHPYLQRTVSKDLGCLKPDRASVVATSVVLHQRVEHCLQRDYRGDSGRFEDSNNLQKAGIMAATFAAQRAFSSGVAQKQAAPSRIRSVRVCSAKQGTPVWNGPLTGSH